VRGNRTQNPYAQNVEPGNYEIYAEAKDHLARRDLVHWRRATAQARFPLVYVQRSGRPELIGFWMGIGAIGGGMAVTTRLNPTQPTNLFLVGAGRTGGLHRRGCDLDRPGSSYIRDNLALFRIGAGWIGDLEGLSLGLALTQGKEAPGWEAWWASAQARWRDVAGRPRTQLRSCSVIQSGAFLGAAAGLLAVPALGFGLEPGSTILADRIGWGLLAGMNVGLVTGLALAYLPDQRLYGPSWQRVILIDLTAVAVGSLALHADVYFGSDQHRVLWQ